MLLADARFPSGGHAHSGGAEEAVDDGLVSDAGSLAELLEVRLGTTGPLAAAVAARAAVMAGHPLGMDCRTWEVFDTEVDARTPSPAWRRSSRRQGRAYLRTGRGLSAAPVLGVVARSAQDRGGPHLPVAHGAVAGAIGLGPLAAATVSLYSGLAGPASAAVRLLGIDPTDATAAVARLAPVVDELARAAAAGATPELASLAELPAPALPGTDWLAERHARRSQRLFAS
jgi:urease accessory protein